jgi:hypothetical protein
VRALVDYPLAILAGLLPRQYWDDLDLPIANVALVSALLTFFGGAALGITGFFEYMAYVLAQREFTLPPFMLAVFISYVLFTPRGLFSLYLLLSGLMRMISGWFDDPLGDPALTLADHLVSRSRRTQQQRSERQARERLERADEPDRRYDGNWAGLTGVDFVIVSARRKPGWTKGTYVMTSDGWFVLGEPYDRPMPNGLRTVYPLTEHKTLDVLRKGVTYELPPLRHR